MAKQQPDRIRNPHTGNEDQIAALQADLRAMGTAERSRVSAWFFKTGKGEYGEGDVFLGVTVPAQRAIAKRYRDLPLPSIKTLLDSAVHEDRLTALIILVGQYSRGDEKVRATIYRFYLAHADRVNNWDLVDSSAPNIVGEYLCTHDRNILDRLTSSRLIWKRRIAIVATLAFIRRGELQDTFRIAKCLLSDREDLVHKATGWMLREAGKKDADALRKFLQRHATSMPRTALRYAIEHFSLGERKAYLSLPCQNKNIRPN